MPRIRTIKPEFWEHEGIGSLTRDARLLYIATWNLADDEGLLRWTDAYLKANVFLYDDDITTKVVQKLMDELEKAKLVHPYRGGTTQQRLGWLVNFRKHQRINRPQPSKLPAPSLQNLAIRRAYGERDDWVCHICGQEIDLDEIGVRRDLSVDHVIPRARGGSDYPSNIAAAHLACNIRKGDRLPDADGDVGTATATRDSMTDSVNGSVNRATTGARTGSSLEGEGKGREGIREGTRVRARCPRHANLPPEDPGPNCIPCRDARIAADAAAAEQQRLAAEQLARETRQQADARALAIANCSLCDDLGYANKRLCDHDPTAAERAARGRAGVDAVLARSRNGGQP